MIRRPPSSPPFPYTTLFRSNAASLAASPLGLLLAGVLLEGLGSAASLALLAAGFLAVSLGALLLPALHELDALPTGRPNPDRKSTRLESSPAHISYDAFCLK